MFQSENMRRRLVLVVEDQEINRDILGVMLEDDYDVIFAENGVEALEQIKKYIDTLSIILLDLVMPVMDGFEVLRQVKSDPNMMRIPVIVLTAEKSAELKALRMGAADFVTKPFDMQEIILARIERLVELSEGRRLIQVAEKDPLTSLYTKGFFYEYAEQMRQYSVSEQFDAVVLNIDRFHVLNDLKGWEFGDSLLKHISEEIQAFLKDSKGLASRMEADNFYIYCVRQPNYLELLERFQRKVDTGSKRVSVHLRMGVCQQSQMTDIQAMFERAKNACNMVRDSYKNSVMIYDEEMHKRNMYYERLLADLEVALEDHQFLVYYQPKYFIQCDPPRLRSAEALVRWKHPEFGMVSPGDFIPLFEHHGLIRLLDAYVWRETAKQIAVWRDRYGLVLPVSVNLSRADVFDPMLEQNLVSLVEEFGLDTKALKLEVTESAYTDDAQLLISVISRLRDLGFEVEMDDFGSGYSSLNMISSLPIDVLKMDMKFIQNVKKNNREFRLVELVLDIARYLGVPVVAEGVENQMQLSLLKDAACDLVQGYFFSRPLPPDEFEELIVREINLTKEMGE